jgi:hypothetical protein
MRKTMLNMAIAAAVGMSSQVSATGLVALPTTGFTVSGGTSAYTICNGTGNFGSGASTAPTTGANNTCAVFPANVNSTPVTGFSIVAAGTATTPLTGNGGEALGTMHQRMFRNAANTSCVYGKYFVMNTTTTFDYNPARAGTNPIEVNDFAFGGFDNTSTVNAGYYFIPSTSSESVFRVGRAYTSVQTHASGGAMATGFLAQPLDSPAPAASTEINGVGQITAPPPYPVPTSGQQTAEIRANWVDFTTDVTGGADEDDGVARPTSSMFYVQADCSSTAPATLANSVKIRQTGQETQPFITISRGGLARNGANANF